MTYQSKHLGVPYQPTEMQKRARQAAQEYYDRTESFDRIHCQATDDEGRRTGIPRTAGERGVIGRNAAVVRKDVLQKYDVPYNEFRQELTKVLVEELR